MQGARLILADEPIASLDPESSRKVMELLKDMNEQHKCTVLVSLHQVEFAVRYCPRTIALNAGRVVFDGPSSALTPAMLLHLLYFLVMIAVGLVFTTRRLKALFLD